MNAPERNGVRGISRPRRAGTLGEPSARRAERGSESVTRGDRRQRELEARKPLPPLTPRSSLPARGHARWAKKAAVSGTRGTWRKDRHLTSLSRRLNYLLS